MQTKGVINFQVANSKELVSSQLTKAEVRLDRCKIPLPPTCLFSVVAYPLISNSAQLKSSCCFSRVSVIVQISMLLPMI